MLRRLFVNDSVERDAADMEVLFERKRHVYKRSIIKRTNRSQLTIHLIALPRTLNIPKKSSPLAERARLMNF
jgi:hypothetical protein